MRILVLCLAVFVRLSPAVVAEPFQALFEAARVDFPGGIGPRAAVATNFDGDAYLDLAIGNDSSLVTIFPGTGDAELSIAATYATDKASAHLAIGDFDGDGRHDLASVGPADNVAARLTILMGNGDGTFAYGTNYVVANGAQCVAVGDFNNNATQDLVVASRYGALGGEYKVFMGNGDGTFAGLASVDESDDPSFIAIYDFNGDSTQDVAIAHYNPDNRLSIRLGNGDGTFASHTNYPMPVNPGLIAGGDFDGDAVVDLAMSTIGSVMPVMLGQGDGSFVPSWTNQVGGASRGVAIADFNGDTNVDVAVACYGRDSFQFFAGNGDGTFAAKTEVGVGGQPQHLAMGDFDGDGNLDAMVANSFDYTISPLLGDGNGGFNIYTQKRHATGFTLQHLAVADFNGDRRDDVAVALFGASQAQIFMGQGDGDFDAPVAYAMAGISVGIAAADLNEDGAPDIVEACHTVGKVSLRLNNGDGTFAAVTNYDVPGTPWWVEALDIDGDAHLDLAVANSSSQAVSVLTGVGDGTFNAATNYPSGGTTRSLAAGDYNGDGKVDLAAVNENSATVAILLGDGFGAFVMSTNYPVGTAPGSVTVADFDADDDLDLATANYGTGLGAIGTVSVLLGAGDGTFAPAVAYRASPNAQRLVTGDFNADGVPDLAVANRSRLGYGGVVSVLTGRGDGTFNATVGYSVGAELYEAQPMGCAVGDFDGDKRKDLAVAVMSDKAFHVLMNIGPFPPIPGTLVLIR